MWHLRSRNLLQDCCCTLLTTGGEVSTKERKVQVHVKTGTKPAKVGRLAPGVLTKESVQLKCGTDGRLRKKVFALRREQSY